MNRQVKRGPTINLFELLNNVTGLVLPKNLNLDRFPFLPKKYSLHGCYGNVVFAMFHSEKCAIKLVHLDEKQTSCKKWEKEVYVSKLMSLHDIGPPIYATGIVNGTSTYGKYTRLGFMVMKRLDCTLEEFDFPKKGNCIIRALRKQGLDKLKKMHSMGRTHEDIHDENIMIQFNPKPMLFFIDFGCSISTTSSDLQDQKCDTVQFHRAMDESLDL